MYRVLVKILYSFLIPCCSAALVINFASAQTIISSDVAGTVTDPNSATLPGATVMLTSVESGSIQTATTNETGSFRSPLLQPGSYKVHVSAPGFAAVSETVTAQVGQVVEANVRVPVKGTSEVVEVTGGAPLLDTESTNLSSTFTPKQIEMIPNPGGPLGTCQYCVQTDAARNGKWVHITSP